MKYTEKTENQFLYNYIERNSKIKIFFSIDFINISLQVNINDLNNIANKLFSLSIRSFFNTTPTSSYNKSKVYFVNYNNKKYEISLSANKIPYMPHLLKINSPDIQILSLLINYLNNFNYHISMVEFSFDFFSNDNSRIFNFLKRHLSIKWAGKQFDPGYETTKYLNNIRKSHTKGARIYIKQENNLDFVRAEVVYKTHLLKRLNINTLDDIIDITPEIVCRYIQFKTLDHYMLGKKLCKLADNGIIEDTEIDKIISEVNLIAEDKDNVEADDYLKQFVKYTCLKMHEFDHKFRGYIRGLSFLNGGVVEIDPEDLTLV